jgi:tripeptide aminopeptidase
MAKEAAAAFGGHAEVVIEPKYQGWSIDPASEHVQAASRAAACIGATPYFTETLGGADTNIFVEHGLTCMTLGIGFQKIHSFDEHISIDNLEAAARHVAAIIEGRTVANQ